MYEIFHKNLKALRNMYGLTQTALCEEIPFLRIKGKNGYKVYSKIEAGKQEPTISEAMELASYYRVPLDVICTVELFRSAEKFADWSVNADDCDVMFPAVLDKITGIDDYFADGVRAYKRFLCGDVTDCDKVKRLFLGSWDTSHREEALVNYLSFTICVGADNATDGDRINYNSFANNDKIRMSRKTALKTVIRSEELMQFFDENDDEILKAIKHLKKNPDWSDLGDYYYALRYVTCLSLGFVDKNSCSMMGVIMMHELEKMGNKYASDLLRVWK